MTIWSTSIRNKSLMLIGELSEIKMLISQVDRKFQGMSIKIIGKPQTDEEAEDSRNEPLKNREKREGARQWITL